MTVSEKLGRWKTCSEYAYRRHILKSADWKGDKVVVNLTDVTDTLKPTDALDLLYQLLTALDSKASALMRLNGVVLAAACFLLNQSGTINNPVLHMATGDIRAIMVTALLSLISILLCMVVVNVRWAFMGRVMDCGETLNFTKEFEDLSKESNLRQLCYRTAWYVSLIAAIVFLGEFLRQTMNAFAL